MPRGRRRGRRTRRHARAARRSGSPKQRTKDETNSGAREGVLLDNSQQHGNKKRVNLVQKQNKVSGQTSAKNKTRNGKREEAAVVHLDDIDIETVEVKLENENKTVTYFQRFRALTSQLCINSRKSSRPTPNTYEVPVRNVISNVTVEKRPDAKTKGRVKAKNHREPVPFTMVKKRKTPYGKVKIYANGKLEDEEEARVTKESVKILKYVQSVNEKKKFEEKQAKDKKRQAERDRITKRLRNLFRTDSS